MSIGTTLIEANEARARDHVSLAPAELVIQRDGRENPAGGAACSVSEGIGWVDLLGVRAPWRRHGPGMALLRHAATPFHQRGISHMALGVDSVSLTGATRLYGRAGMHIAQHHATYGKVLREGADHGHD